MTGGCSSSTTGEWPATPGHSGAVTGSAVAWLDALTGLSNRRHFNQVLRELMANASPDVEACRADGRSRSVQADQRDTRPSVGDALAVPCRTASAPGDPGRRSAGAAGRRRIRHLDLPTARWPTVWPRAWSTSCRVRSSSKATSPTSAPASASPGSPSTGPRPTTWCATPNWRCTRQNPRAGGPGGCSIRPWRRRRMLGGIWKPAFAGRWR